LKAVKMVDDAGFLVDDPRASDWREALAPLAGADRMQPDKSALSEVLNVAYAMHELSADHFEDDLAWMEANAKGSVSAVAAGVGAAARAAATGVGVEAVGVGVAAGAAAESTAAAPRRAAA
jgi:hypothetical protein